MIAALNISCQKASELADKSTIFKLSFKESIALKLHTRACQVCKNYQNQSKMIDKFLINHIGEYHENLVPKITNQALKEKIMAKL